MPKVAFDIHIVIYHKEEKVMTYSIEGEPMPVVICNLENGEAMITEKGAMSWMSPNMKMETISNGGVGKMFGRRRAYVCKQIYSSER